ncbi:hypothetical protein KCU65_g63, partial [Aureobasidium melanogenum]
LTRRGYKLCCMFIGTRTWSSQSNNCRIHSVHRPRLSLKSTGRMLPKKVFTNKRSKVWNRPGVRRIRHLKSVSSLPTKHAISSPSQYTFFDICQNDQPSAIILGVSGDGLALDDGAVCHKGCDT